MLDAIYAAYGTGWDLAHADEPRSTGLTAEAVRLATIVTELLPDDAEAHGLLALLLHSRARRDARFDDDGEFVPIAQHDTTTWSREDIGQAETHLAQALALGQLGRYQLHAAVHSLHNRRAATGHTDWSAITKLYDGLAAIDPCLGTLVARAAGIAEAQGPNAGLQALDEIGDSLQVRSYQPYWVVRTELLHGNGDDARTIEAARIAVDLTTEPAIASYPRRRYPTD